MKTSPRLRPLAAALACAFITHLALQAQTATTTPVGFVTLTIPAATNSTTPSNTVVSVPLYQTAAWTSSVVSIDSTNQFTLTGAAWTAGQFAVATAPYWVRITASTVAANIGQLFLISANTTSQLTVVLPTGITDIHNVLTVGDTCEIDPASTLGSVFGNATTPPTLTGGTTANTADNVLIWNGTGWDPYYWTGTLGTPNNIWKKSGNIDRTNTIIYPDEAVFVIRRDTTSAAILTLMGAVPSTSEQTPIAPAGSTFLSNRFPVNMTLGTVAGSTLPALNLQNIPGWLAGATSNTADTVYISNGAGWDTYYWTGTVGTPNNIWKKSGNIDRSNTVINAGSGIFINHAGPQLTLTQSLPYSLLP